MRKKNWGKTNETLFAKANYDSAHANHQCYEWICTGYQHLNRNCGLWNGKISRKKNILILDFKLNGLRIVDCIVQCVK